MRCMASAIRELNICGADSQRQFVGQRVSKRGRRIGQEGGGGVERLEGATQA